MVFNDCIYSDSEIKLKNEPGIRFDKDSTLLKLYRLKTTKNP